MLRVCLLLLAAVAALPAQTNWKLIWSDEFNDAAGTRPNPQNWTYDIGAGGWGNAELETYTNTAENASMDGNGNLAIRALRSGSAYTSARIKTQGGLFSFTYGKVEARIRIPYGQGIWPAFWLLGENITTVGWPTCGEVDIMENIGREPFTVHGALHSAGYDSTDGYTLSGGARFSDDFQLFTAIWNEEGVEFLVDGISYGKRLKSSMPAASWVFNKPFFIILNVAVGGRWPGNPDDTSTFPQEMLVDYVRVYQGSTAGIANAASFETKLAPGALAALFGSNLANGTYDNVFDQAHGRFPALLGDTVVRVNGVDAALTYAGPGQINFQVPWETPTGVAVPVEVRRNGVPTDLLSLTVDAAAPSAFAYNGAAIVICSGIYCTIYGNGFGVLNPPQQNGVPVPLTQLPRPAGECRMTINGLDAPVDYCGGAPNLVIDQLNFRYPSGLPTGSANLPAVLTIGGVSGSFPVPAPRE